MNDSGSTPTELHQSIGAGPEVAGKRAPNGGPIGGVLTLCLASFGVMVPWPLLAILITHSYLDNWNEAALLFGGITGIPLAILALFGLPETVFVVLLVLVWVAAAVVPDVWLARRLSSWQLVFMLLGAQACFSLAQATMGALMIFGKAV